MRKVNLMAALAGIREHWSPRIAGERNGQHVKLAKFQGEILWPMHDGEDELFFVLDGRHRGRAGRIPLRANRKGASPSGLRRSFGAAV
jgi:mannose-6-phosphate isomerase-like protein (cupin superfamily)